jgi:cytochrome c oxidase cbb3-type subunit 3
MCKWGSQSWLPEGRRADAKAQASRGLKPALRFFLFALAVPAFLGAQAGPYERQRPDSAAAASGRRVYSQYCINCHGALAKGTEQGPDLIRSIPVMRDRSGSELGPALKKLPDHKRDLTPEEVAAISDFLKREIEDTSKNRNTDTPPNVLTGNAAAGRAYFNGAGRCSTCHSPSGDLAGVGRKYDPINLQQRFLFPRRSAAKRIEVTVTPASGAPVSGVLERIDDFEVALRDVSGQYRSWHRTPDLAVDVRDPLAAHYALLDEYTDADMHNVVTYLESLK